jgi:hypothetical protein
MVKNKNVWGMSELQDMHCTVIRLMEDDNNDSTAGAFYIDGKGECFTLEDEAREVKVKHETCIPEGTYEITLRTEGGFHERYLKKFGEAFHKGMLWVRNVPNFEYILIHCGNTDKHTSGCLLLGKSIQKGFLGSSVDAYKEAYPKIAAHLLKGGKVFITYTSVNINAGKLV